MLLERLSELLCRDVDDAAREMAGNWARWPNFVWFGSNDVADPEDVMLGYLVDNRDPSVWERTNLRVIRHRLKAFWGDAPTDLVWDFGSSVWGDRDALSGLAMRVVQDGKATEPFRMLMEIARELDESEDGILDLSVFNEIRRSDMKTAVCRELDIDAVAFWDDCGLNSITDELLSDGYSVEESDYGELLAAIREFDFEPEKDEKS